MELMPIYINSDKFSCLIIGGGKAAKIKLKALLKNGIKPTCISPVINEDISVLVKENELVWNEKKYTKGDIRDFNLVIIATDNESLNSDIVFECEQRNLLFVDTTNPQRGNFIIPASIKKADLNIAITSSGNSPLLVRRLRKHIEDSLPKESEDMISEIGRLRRDIIEKSHGCEVEKKRLMNEELTPLIDEFIKNIIR